MPFAVNLWNKLVNRAPPQREGAALGMRVEDGRASRKPYRLANLRRTEHIVILGKTGTGKTSLIKTMLASDVRDRRGFLCIDLHGDLLPFILSKISEQERQTGKDLSERTIVIDPADRNASVGLNILESHAGLFPLVSEVVAIFRRRWQLDHFGARTEELLRNCLLVLAEQRLTLTELSTFLTDLGFRAPLIQRTTNVEVKAYFRDRYEQFSDAMQVAVREPILNKASAFTTDPTIRHLVGQTSSLDLRAALDSGKWIILHLSKAQLGENSETLASLILARLKNTIFARRSRNLFTVYADEVQNLVSSSDTLEHLFAEARKFAVSVVTANQNLQQYPAAVRVTLLAAGTTIFFRSSPEDAPYMARALDGGPSVERRLKELPNRHFLIRSGSDRWCEVQTSEISERRKAASNLLSRSSQRWARPRSAIEEEIQNRRRVLGRKEELAGWT